MLLVYIYLRYSCHPERSPHSRTKSNGPAFAFRTLHPPQISGAPCPNFGTWDTTNQQRAVILSEVRTRGRSRTGSAVALRAFHPPQETGAPCLDFETWDTTNQLRAVILSEVRTRGRSRRICGCSSRLPPTSRDGCPMSQLWDMGYHEPTTPCHPERSPHSWTKSKDLRLLFAPSTHHKRRVPHVPTLGHGIRLLPHFRRSGRKFRSS